jgi:hypothetical protein
MGIRRFENIKGKGIISGMLVRRFALGIAFAVLAMAGEAGAALESMSYEGEHCLLCEVAARPVSKTSPTRDSDTLQQLNAEQQIIRGDLNNNIACFTRSCSNNPSVSHHQVLLI